MFQRNLPPETDRRKVEEHVAYLWSEMWKNVITEVCLWPGQGAGGQRGKGKVLQLRRGRTSASRLQDQAEKGLESTCKF
eukprot:12890894-Prorocentrum_lima.AAC.1